MNYYAFDDGTPAKLQGIAKKWRQFVLWHNAGYSGEAPGYDETTPDIFNNNWRYSVSNYSNPDERKINKSLFALKAGAEITTAFSAFASSHPYLSPNFTLEGCNVPNSNWIVAEDPQDRNVIWRKPIPFVFDGTAMTPHVGESFTNPRSYRFFAEFLSFYTGMFGSGTGTNFDNLITSGRYETGATVALTGLNDFMEIWNEPTAHWTKPNNYGYFTPDELAAMSHAAIGGGGVTTNIGGTAVSVGIRDTDPSMKIIAPSMHDMDLTYHGQYLAALKIFRPDFLFDVHNFHHYSAYNAIDLYALSEGGELNSSTIVAASMNRDANLNDICYVIEGESPQFLETVDLEAAPSAPGAFWLCPELDGYVERGNTLFDNIASDDFLGEDVDSPEGGTVRVLKNNAQVWVTEWGYPSESGGYASYPSQAGDNLKEIQARWIMRGFMEYGRSRVETSYLHWLQDTGGELWDTKSAGILSIDGNRKKSWYYLKTMMSEIGGKKITRAHTLGDCEPNFVPGITVSPSTLTPIDPESSCPKIYCYTEDTPCLEAECISDYNETVYAIWYPYMINKEDESILINLDELGLENSLGVQQYYWVSPEEGYPDGVTSTIESVIFDGEDNSIPGVIDIPITEKPIFLHIKGLPEAACSGVITPLPENCEPDFTAVLQDSSCLQLQIKVTITGLEGKCNVSEVDLNSVIASIGTQNSEPDNIALLSNVEQGVNSNEFIITMSGLNPDTDYSFTFGAQFQASNESVGYVGGETQTFTTTGENCLDGVIPSLNCGEEEINFGSEYGNTTIITSYINTGSLLTEDLIFFSLEGCVFELDAAGERIEPCIPIPSGLSIDWLATGGSQFQHSIEISNLTFGQDYELEIFITNAEGTLVTETTVCEFSIAENPNFPPIVTLITPTISNDCDMLETCITPVTSTDNPNTDEVEPDQLVTAYTQVLRDQDGEIIAQFYQEFAGEDPTQFCFDPIDISNFSASAIFIQIVASGSGSSFSSHVEIELCCDEDGPRNREYMSISNYICKINGGWNPGSAFYYNIFDFSDQNEACRRGYEVSVSSNWENLSLIEYPSFPNQYGVIMYSPSEAGFPCDIEYTVTVTLADGFSYDMDFEVELPQVCCDAPILIETDDVPTHMKIDTLMSTPDLFLRTSDGKVVVRSDASIIDDIIESSKQNNTEVWYAVYDTYEEEPLLSFKEYKGKLEFTLPPNDIEDAGKLHNRFEVHLLADNFFYNMGLPITSERPADEREANTDNNDKSVNALSVFPNPTKGNTSVKLRNGTIERISLISLTGERVMKTFVGASSTEIDLNYHPGFYVLEITTLSGEILLEKIILQ